MTLTDYDHDDYMNKLALRISKVLDGEQGFDAACACVLCATFALKEVFRDDQAGAAEALEKVIGFMRQQLAEP